MAHSHARGDISTLNSQTADLSNVQIKPKIQKTKKRKKRQKFRIPPREKSQRTIIPKKKFTFNDQHSNLVLAKNKRYKKFTSKKRKSWPE